MKAKFKVKQLLPHDKWDVGDIVEPFYPIDDEDSENWEELEEELKESKVLKITDVFQTDFPKYSGQYIVYVNDMNVGYSAGSFKWVKDGSEI